MTKHRIVPVEPTEDQEIAMMEASLLGRSSVDDPAYVNSIHAAMLSAAEPFEWPEEALFEAALAVSRVLGLNDDPTYAQIAEAALNAALKDVEGRE